MREVRKIPIAAMFVSLYLFLSLPANAGKAQENAGDSSGNTVACRVLEAHASAEGGLLIVLFRQRDAGDQMRFSTLLKLSDGSTVEIQVGNERPRVSVMRLRDCFGRGLLVAPSNLVKWKDGDEFEARFTAAGPRS